MAHSLLPPPNRLADLFQGGKITREQFQAAMRHHQRTLLLEISEARRNPILAYLDERLSKHAASRLVRRHGERFLRQVFEALGRIEDFPPAQLLWNAGHLDVPLHCFLRLRREPVFRIVKIDRSPLTVTVVVEHGRAAKRQTTRAEFILSRDRFGNLSAGQGRS